MKIVFVSNYYNHHQAALSEALYRLADGQYAFVQTEEMEKERTQMGWNIQLPEFVKCSYESKAVYEECLQLIFDADAIIFGGSPTVEKLVQKRIKAGKLCFRYSERVYKNTALYKQLPLRAVKYHLCNFPYKNVYLLCASAYAAADYAKTGNFLGKAYQWGYFPEVKEYEQVERLFLGKTPGSILWGGRLIDWKHPEACIEIAKRLKAEKYDFKLQMIGSGEMAQTLQEMIQEEDLTEQVELLGTMRPEQVRACMEKAAVFLFTSDFGEGWGAVLNESMNSGCAVIASHAIGAAPYLVQDGENGMLYRNGDLDDLYRKVKLMLDEPDRQRQLGRNAYRTMTQLWNAEVAAQRLMELAQHLLAGERKPDLFADGPCSVAKTLENDWYQA